MLGTRIHSAQNSDNNYRSFLPWDLGNTRRGLFDCTATTTDGASLNTLFLTRSLVLEAQNVIALMTIARKLRMRIIRGWGDCSFHEIRSLGRGWRWRF